MPSVVSAHTSNLGIDGYNGTTYDDCIEDDYNSATDIGDGYDEKWYDLIWDYSEDDEPTSLEMHHVDDDINTLYYQFQDHSYDDPSITWATTIGEILGNLCKIKFEESMLKWNKVYYYKLNDEGIYEKLRIINLVNYDSLSDKSNITPNILIYPFYDSNEGSDIAIEEEIDSSEIESDTKIQGEIVHKHFSQFRIHANTAKLYANPHLQNRTGAHEIGHVLGLSDIDKIENSNENNYHHEEILMGYSKGDTQTRQSEITYKDIAGVSIIRGFHTDDDHIWLYDENSPKNGKEKLICSLCNCIKYVDDLSLYDYYEYEQCGHNKNNLPSTVDENMIPVACYGNADYYKCKYCRYVAPFTSLVAQNYYYCGEYNKSGHLCENNNGILEYEIWEPHNTNISLGDNNYKCSVCGYQKINNFEEYNLSDSSSTVSEIVNLGANKTKYYKINSNYEKYYEFIIESNSDINVKLYNDNFQEITVTDLNASNLVKHIVKKLEYGTYYLVISNSHSFTNMVSINIKSVNSIYSNYGENNILLNQYNNIKNYIYTNTNERGLYKITLSANKQSGTVNYPQSCIKIYKDSSKQELVTRLETDFYTLDSEASNGSNNLIVFLEKNYTYYIDINLNDDIYSSLTLNIEKIEYTYEVDMFDYEEDVYEEELILDEDTSNYGDFIQKVEIKQTGSYTVSFIHDLPIEQGPQSQNFLYCVFFKETSFPVEESSNLQLLIPEMATAFMENMSFQFTLQKGIYYIGYYNKLNNEPMTISIRYNISVYDTEKIISDPEPITTCGSMVNIYEKDMENHSFRGSNIVVGFTRILYFDPILEIESRTDYSWYSSDEDIATISQFGTLFGKSAGTVKIMAVSKQNLEIVYVKTFIVTNDNQTDNSEKVSIINDTHNTNDGIYKLGLTVLNCPYPSCYLYTWSILSHDETITNIEMDTHGNLTIDGYGNVVIKGYNYYYNNKYSVQINLIVN